MNWKIGQETLGRMQHTDRRCDGALKPCKVCKLWSNEGCCGLRARGTVAEDFPELKKGTIPWIQEVKSQTRLKTEVRAEPETKRPRDLKSCQRATSAQK